MDMDMFHRAELVKDSFTKSERKIYQLIQDEPETIKLCTIVQLAGLAGTSKSAVLRFCQKIGYSGYSEFRYNFLEYLRHHGKQSDNSPAAIISACVSSYQGALSQMKSLNNKQIDGLVKCIKDAPVVKLLGLGESGCCARQLASNLNLLGKPSIAITDMIEYYRTAQSVAEKDIFICFSVGGQYKAYQELPSAIKSAGARLVLITTNPKAPLKKYADIVMLLPTAPGIKHTSLDVHPLMFVFITIFTEYYQRKI